MMKRTIIPLALVCILVTVVLVAPVSAVGILTIDDVKITTVDGSTSPMLVIQDFPINQSDTITIDVSALNEYVESGNFTVDNVWVTSWPVEWSLVGIHAESVGSGCGQGDCLFPIRI